VRSSGELIAMGGERLVFPGYAEISAVCTHPAQRGKGYAEALIWHLIREHRRLGIVSWLHVGSANHNAIKLYLKMGFERVRTVKLHRVSRSGFIAQRLKGKKTLAKRLQIPITSGTLVLPSSDGRPKAGRCEKSLKI